MDVSALKQKALIETIYARTIDQRQIWSGTSVDDVFSTSIGLYTIHISVEGNDYWVYIYDEEGELVESFSDVTLNGVAPSVAGYESFFGLMKQLHRMAARSASGAEKVLDALLEELGVPNPAINSDDEAI